MVLAVLQQHVGIGHRRMDGSLDQPPLIIRRSRAKSLLMLFACAAFAGFGLLTWRATDSWLVKAGVVMFGLGCPLFAWELIRQDRLVISPKGLDWLGPWKKRTYSWNDLSEFSIYSIRGAKMIGFSRAGLRGMGSIVGRLNTALTGASGALPGLWEIEPEKVADILNQARSRWADQAEPGHKP